MVAIVEKAKNAGISLYPREIEAIAARSKIRDGGSPTRYFRRLWEADEKGQPVPTSYDPDILRKMAETYAGFLAPQLGAQLAERGADQPRLLHDLLIQLSDYFAAGGQIADLMIGSRAQFAAATYPERQQPAPPLTKAQVKQRQRAQAATAPADPSANEDPATVSRAARPLARYPENHDSEANLAAAEEAGISLAERALRAAERRAAPTPPEAKPVEGAKAGKGPAPA